MEKITYGKSASSRVAAMLRLIRAKYARTPYTLVEGKEENASKVWEQLCYKKTSDIPEQEAEALRSAKGVLHPIFFEKKVPLFVKLSEYGGVEAKGIESMGVDALIPIFWSNDIEALQKAGAKAVEDEVAQKLAYKAKAKAAAEAAAKEKAAKATEPKTAPVKKAVRKAKEVKEMVSAVKPVVQKTTARKRTTTKKATTKK